MKTHIMDALQVIAALLITGGMVASAAPLPAKNATEPSHEAQTAVVAQKPVTKPSEAPTQPVVQPEAPAEPQAVIEPEPVAVAPQATTSTGENENIVWNYLIAQGFTRNQTAGIMGNLQQEHGFNTTGDGLAQWLGGRRDNLMARANPYDINTQVAFLMEELNGSYAGVKAQILATDNIETVVIIFQNKFEVCNPYYCMQSQRINYAYSILARH